MFLDSFFPLAAPTVRVRGRIELPFGRGKTNPVAAADVASVVATVLADPAPHLGRIRDGHCASRFLGAATLVCRLLILAQRRKAVSASSSGSSHAALKPRSSVSISIR
jgi:hypothetical protein